MLAVVSCSKPTDNDLEPILELVTITDENFEELLISQGIDSDGIVNQQMLKTDAEKVTKLSLYGANINTLDGIEAFINLRRLIADANNLTTIDLSNNVLLDTISLTSNRLTKIVGLEKAENLTWLSLSWNYFTEFTLDNDNVKIVESDEEIKPFFRKTDNMIFMNYLNLDRADMSIKIYDTESRTVFTQEVADELIVEKAFNFTDAFPGTYTVTVKSAGKTYTDEFVVN